MESSRSVALVGRPNVGKSRLFNCLARRRIAIVHDEPGVTRDVNAVEVDDDYILMDTGGIGLAAVESDSDLSDAVENQINFAIQAAAVILLVVDGREGRTPLDDLIVERLRKSGKSPVLVVNKIDAAELEPRAGEFDELGVKESCLVSAEHGRGIGDLRSIVDRRLGPRAEKEPPPTSVRTGICFAGRPNVGKSSLCNRIIRSDRLVVSEVPGTTRDSVDLDLDMPGPNGSLWQFRITDTAGLKRSGKLKSSVEYFSSVRSAGAIERADIAYLVVDAVTGITRQDKAIAGQIVEAGKAIAVVVNKWDLAIDRFRRDPLPGYENETDFRDHFARAVRKELFFLPRSPVLFVSALHGLGMNEILAVARRLEERSSRDLPTAQVNKLVARLFDRQKSRYVGGKQFKIYYAVQTGYKPYRIRLYCNTAGHLEDGYRRYLQAGFVSEFSLDGCPVKFQLVGKGTARTRLRQRKQRRSHGSG